MQFSFATILALFAVANGLVVETPLESTIRRDVLIQERAGVNANRPVASGQCCVANTSLKEDVCTTATGANGVCVPLGASFNCQGALNCIEKSTLTCNPNVLENGRPTCR